jgi:hypothetical protein
MAVLRRYRQALALAAVPDRCREPAERRRADGGGAASHCAHGEAGGDALREYLDWRPFSYVTNRFTPLPNGDPLMPRSIETTEFIPLDGGATSVHWRIKLEDRSEVAVRQFETVAGFIQANVRELWEDPLSKVLEEDGVAPGLGDNADVPEP